MGYPTVMEFQEHHFRNLGRARDHLTETIVSLRSATERMTGDDWIDLAYLVVGTTFGVYVVPNEKRKPKPGPLQEPQPRETP